MNTNSANQACGDTRDVINTNNSCGTLTVNGNNSFYIGETRATPAAIVSGIRNIEIKPLNYGYVVTIGCQQFAIDSVAKLIKNLEEYLLNPEQTEISWMNNKKLKY